MTLPSKKIDNVLCLDAQGRSDYFVRKVADFESVWGLFDQGWATAEIENTVAIPFWPEKEFAELCATDEWGNFHPKSISLNDFLSRWLPGMEQDRRVCLLFPVPGKKGKVVYPADLLAIINNETEQYK